MAVKRGLCIACYEKMRREKEKLPKSERSAFERHLMGIGVMLPDGREPKNVFVATRIEIEQRKVAEAKADYVAPAPHTPLGKPKPLPPPAAAKQARRKRSS